MAVSSCTRTHLIYQFLILTLLFLIIGYNELLPERKFILYLAFIPMFCYQLIILSCCVELIPVPPWMNFGASKACIEKSNESPNSTSFSPLLETDSLLETTKKLRPLILTDKRKKTESWKKSVSNLESFVSEIPKSFTHPQKAKSWVNLCNTTQDSFIQKEQHLKIESSKALASMDGRIKDLPEKSLERSSCLESRKETNNINKTVGAMNTGTLDPLRAKLCTQSADYRPSGKRREYSLPNCNSAKEDSEIDKSYSFPFRQKRLEKWMDLKEKASKEVERNLNVPYWQTIGYNVAVKYEARRRRIGVANVKQTSESKTSSAEQSQSNASNELTTSSEVSVQTTPSVADKAWSKKSVAKPLTGINKVKMGISNFISKSKKCEKSGNHKVIFNKKSEEVIRDKSEKNVDSVVPKKDEPLTINQFPTFKSNGRPVIFYPKHIPFEKDRFEKDVQKKMLELDEEQKKNNNAYR